MGFCTAPVERRDKEESNWIKVDQLIKAGDSGRPTRGGALICIEITGESDHKHKEIGWICVCTRVLERFSVRGINQIKPRHDCQSPERAVDLHPGVH